MSEQTETTNLLDIRLETVNNLKLVLTQIEEEKMIPSQYVSFELTENTIVIGILGKKIIIDYFINDLELDETNLDIFLPRYKNAKYRSLTRDEIREKLINEFNV